MSSGTRLDAADSAPGEPFGVGDLVVVRAADRIRESLDAMGRRDGCCFMPPMYRHCGKRFRIVKVVKNVFDEGKLRMNVLKFPVYILDGVICEGRVDAFRDPCDKCCFVFWHRDWLEKG